MKYTALLVVAIAAIAAVLAADYCRPTLCGVNLPHIGCNNTGAYGPSCPTGAHMIDLSTEQMQELVDSHNTKRNVIAAGNLPGFLPAAQMATTRWDEELAYLAGLNVIRCIFEHDKCRKTDQFQYSGQNIGKTAWTGGNPADLDIMLGHIDSFWSEYRNAYMSQIDSFPTSTNATIGHFTVMTAEKNTAVGCAAVKFVDSGNWTNLIMACNYARTNLVGYKMYESGETGSKCTTGMNPDYPALCSLQEPYPVKAP